MTQTPEPDRIQEIDNRLEGLETQLTELRQRAEADSGYILNLQRISSELLDIARLHQQALRVAQYNAESDRAAIREMQTEVRQIWQYLLEQRPNGQQG